MLTLLGGEGRWGVQGVARGGFGRWVCGRVLKGFEEAHHSNSKVLSLLRGASRGVQGVEAFGVNGWGWPAVTVHPMSKVWGRRVGGCEGPRGQAGGFEKARHSGTQVLTLLGDREEGDGAATG